MNAGRGRESESGWLSALGVSLKARGGTTVRDTTDIDQRVSCDAIGTDAKGK